MVYQRRFFDGDELNVLIDSVRRNYNPAVLKNRLFLDRVDSVVNKVKFYISEKLNEEMEFLNINFIFLASRTTMDSIHNSVDEGWHTDSSCSVIDGDCYNAWIPLYNDSADTGIEVISEQKNQTVFSNIDDPTYPLSVYSGKALQGLLEKLPIKIPSDTNMILVKAYPAIVLPLSTGQLNVSRYEAPQAGDLAVFKQTDIHRGFHSGGIRIQLSMKFCSKQARLNQGRSNTYYPLFKRFIQDSGQEGSSSLREIKQFNHFLDLFTPKNSLSKHGRLEQDLIYSLLGKPHDSIRY